MIVTIQKSTLNRVSITLLVLGMLTCWIEPQLTKSAIIGLGLSSILFASGTLLIVIGLGIQFLLLVHNTIDASLQQVRTANAALEAHPEKAKPAWDLARATLEAYFNRNLLHINAIFWLSVVVMLTGFSVLICGIVTAFDKPSALPAAIIASASGVITEFIGATFLFIYKSTIQQASSYTQTLEHINSAGMAMQILDTIPDDANETDLKSRTKAAIVIALVNQAHRTHDSSNAAAKDPCDE